MNELEIAIPKEYRQDFILELINEHNKLVRALTNLETEVDRLLEVKRETK